VVVLTVFPEDEVFARERGWVEEGEAYDPAALAADLEADVAELAPDAAFRYELAEDVSSVSTTTMDIARTIRRVAAELDASVVFIGSENAGRVSAPVSSVGGPVSEDPRYDVYIVRHTDR
jgi:nucleotide-binding universal stress UspA family protein